MDLDLTIPGSLISRFPASRQITILTGAGVSAESGIPTFRDRLSGLWQRFNAEALATPAAFRSDPAPVWGWYEWRRMKALRAEPNPAHFAIAEMAQRVPELTVITQNVDNLHERAGSENVTHLHGSLHAPRCFACARPFQLPAEIPDEPEGGRRLEPPHCLHCGGRIRPGVVWFGEPVRKEAWEAAAGAVRSCDLFMSVGTSSVVFPVADLMNLAAGKRATIVQVNPRPTRWDELATFSLPGPAGEVLPELVTAAWGMIGGATAWPRACEAAR